jgi:hypothetical protein
MTSHGVVLKVGDIVTFSFDAFSRISGPRYPKLERIRKDISWEDVLRSHFLDSKISGTSYIFIYLRILNTTKEPTQYQLEGISFEKVTFATFSRMLREVRILIH